jgi:transcription termination factor Rho
MAESRNRSSRTGGEQRPRAEGETRSGGSRSRTLSPEDLRELAEELEEHGRALLARARELQRMAGAAQGSAGRSTTRSERPDRGQRTERGERSERTERGERGGSSGPRRQSGRSERGESAGGRQSGGSSRPKRDRDESPNWAPKPKRRRT